MVRRNRWESVFILDRKNLCVMLKSGRKVLLEKEVLNVVSTAEMAQVYWDAMNRKQFCHNKRVFRPNSWIPRIFALTLLTGEPDAKIRNAKNIKLPRGRGIRPKRINFMPLLL